MMIKHLTMSELEAGLEDIRLSPKESGTLTLIVRRPQIDLRESLTQGELEESVGLVGDSWVTRGSSATADGSAHPERQLTIMNVRAIKLFAQEQDRWQLAGDQMYIDLDLSTDNLPPGTRLSVGSAVLEVTTQPHNGCKKFVERFGLDAMQFVNSTVGRQLRLRGIYVKVVQPGLIQVGDLATKL